MTVDQIDNIIAGTLQGLQTNRDIATTEFLDALKKGLPALLAGAGIIIGKDFADRLGKGADSFFAMESRLQGGLDADYTEMLTKLQDRPAIKWAIAKLAVRGQESDQFAPDSSKFATYLRLAIVADAEQTRRGARILDLLDSPDGPRKARKIARLKRHALAEFELPTVAEGIVDWSAVNWDMWLRIIGVLLTLLMFFGTETQTEGDEE